MLKLAARQEIAIIGALQLRETTPRFCYRPISQADAYPFYTSGAYDDIGQYLGWGAAGVEEAIARVRGLADENVSAAAVSLSIVDKYTGRWCGFFRWAPFDDSLSLHLWVDTALWEQEHAMEELLDQALTHTFCVTSLDTLHCLVHTRNTRMRRLVQESGMHSQSCIEGKNVFSIGYAEF